MSNPGKAPLLQFQATNVLQVWLMFTSTQKPSPLNEVSVEAVDSQSVESDLKILFGQRFVSNIQFASTAFLALPQTRFGRKDSQPIFCVDPLPVYVTMSKYWEGLAIGGAGEFAVERALNPEGAA